MAECQIGDGGERQEAQQLVTSWEIKHRFSHAVGEMAIVSSFLSLSFFVSPLYLADTHTHARTRVHTGPVCPQQMLLSLAVISNLPLTQTREAVSAGLCQAELLRSAHRPESKVLLLS